MKNWIIYIVGIILFSLGAKFFVSSNLETNPLGALSIGMNQPFDLLMGTSPSLTITVSLVLSFIISKKIPRLISFITALIVVTS